jgi:hypothetical protein
MEKQIPERRKEHIEVFTRLEEKIDSLSKRVCVHEDHHEYIARVMAREARKESFQRAIIEKTTISLVWSFIVGIGYLIWQGITSHWKW